MNISNYNIPVSKFIPARHGRFAGAVAVALAAGIASAAASSSVTSVRGQPTVTNPGQGAAQILQAGQSLQPGAKIATNGNARIEIHPCDGVSVAIQPDSDVQLEQSQTDGEGASARQTAVLALRRGGMRCRIGSAVRGSIDLRINTPNATVSGTEAAEFLLVVTSDHTRVEVVRGSVSLTNAAARTVTLSAAQYVILREGETNIVPASVPAPAQRAISPSRPIDPSINASPSS